MIESIALSAAPALAMLVMSFAGYAVKVPIAITAAMQHLAAGLLLCAIAVELCPVLSAAPSDLPNISAILLGFFGALALFLLLGAFCEVEEADGYGELEEEVTEKSRVRPLGSTRRTTELRATRRPKLTTASRHTIAAVAAPPFPVSFAVAVCVDAFVDGFLIGISGSSGASAGLVMAVALTIEMGFLGLTFALAVSKQKPAVALAAVVLPPAILIVGGVGGTFAAEGLSRSPVLHVGLIAFGVSALLYLVTAELLLEAHHAIEEQPWWVTIMLFVGFVLAFLIQKAVDSLGGA